VLAGSVYVSMYYRLIGFFLPCSKKQEVKHILVDKKLHKETTWSCLQFYFPKTLNNTQQYLIQSVICNSDIQHK